MSPSSSSCSTRLRWCPDCAPLRYLRLLQLRLRRREFLCVFMCVCGASIAGLSVSLGLHHCVCLYLTLGRVGRRISHAGGGQSINTERVVFDVILTSRSLSFPSRPARRITPFLLLDACRCDKHHLELVRYVVAAVKIACSSPPVPSPPNLSGFAGWAGCPSLLLVDASLVLVILSQQ